MQKGVRKGRQGTGEAHPICKTNAEGVSKAKELLAHMLNEAPKIVEEARSEARLHEEKKKNDGGFHGEKQDAEPDSGEKSCCLKLGCFENCLKNERRHLPPKVITLKIF